MRTQLFPSHFPSRPDHSGQFRPPRARAAWALLVGVLCLPAFVGCAATEPAPEPTPPAGPTSTAPSLAATTTARPTPPGRPASSLVPVWPFTSPVQAQTWQAGYRADGREAWHLDVEQTALRFTREHLGYTEIDRVTSRTVRGADAVIGVGWNDDNGTAHTVGELHLVRVGTALDAPWAVVGSEDTYLTLTSPRYGATVSSPLRVGGRITGVDESLRILVLGPTSGVPLGETGGIPAGGQDQPWTATVRFSAVSSTVLTIAVSTGGHLKGVERFAITAARAA